MTSIKNILVATILSASLFGTAQADEQTMKPVQGVSFHAGTKHAIAYFLRDVRTCKLVVTSVDDANFAPTRDEADMQPGMTTTYHLTDGKALEFACQAQARAVSITPLQTVAGN